MRQSPLKLNDEIDHAIKQLTPWVIKTRCIGVEAREALTGKASNHHDCFQLAETVQEFHYSSYIDFLDVTQMMNVWPRSGDYFGAIFIGLEIDSHCWLESKKFKGSARSSDSGER